MKTKNVAHAWNSDFPYLLLRDIPWWVDKRGIFVRFRSNFVAQKIRKNCTRCRPCQIWWTLVRGVSTQELHSWKLQKQVCSSSFCVFVWKALANRLSTGGPSSIYEQLFIRWPLHCYMTRVICIFIRICMGKITIVSVTYENVVIYIKIVLPYLSWVFFFLLCGLWADLWPFLLVLEEPVCSLYIYFPRLGTWTKQSIRSTEGKLP